ncbi:MAG: hypothetical protein D6808_00840 [Candidatus Dadabacteria bacterium]|nr:MAG: hypothetical protein D6808_00840 [Candidatus Dadabacteria bacterium]
MIGDMFENRKESAQGGRKDAKAEGPDLKSASFGPDLRVVRQSFPIREILAFVTNRNLASTRSLGFPGESVATFLSGGKVSGYSLNPEQGQFAHLREMLFEQYPQLRKVRPLEPALDIALSEASTENDKIRIVNEWVDFVRSKLGLDKTIEVTAPKHTDEDITGFVAED